MPEKEFIFNSSFILGPNDNLEEKIEKLKIEYERINENSVADVVIFGKNTQGLTAQHTEYYYGIQLKELD